MIAIAPKLAAGVTPAEHPSSKGSVSGKEVITPFSTVLEKAKGSVLDAPGTKGTLGDAGPEGFPVSGTTKHEGKTSESKTGKAKSHGDATSQDPVSSSDTSNQESLPAVLTTIPVPILPWNPGLIKVVPQGATAAGAAMPDQSNAATSVAERAKSVDTSISGTMIHLGISKDASPAKSTDDLHSSQKAPVPNFAVEHSETVASVVKDTPGVPFGNVKAQAWSAQARSGSKQAETVSNVVKDTSRVPVANVTAQAWSAQARSGSKQAETVSNVVKDTPGVPVGNVKAQAWSAQARSGSKQAETVASVVKDSSEVPVANAKGQASVTQSPVVEATRGTAESAPTLNAIHSAAQPTPDQPAAVPPVADPVLISPTPLPVLETVLVPATFDGGVPDGLTGKPTSDRAKAGVTPEIKGAARKNVDTLGNTKAAAGKSDTAPLATGQTADHGTSSTPAKAVASSEAPLAGAPVVPTVSPNATASVTGAGRLPQSTQPDHESPVLQGQPLQELPGSYPASVVHSGKLLERIGETELRLGLRTGEFGSVDIRTSMIRNQFTAEISAERGDLGRMLVAELPGLQTRLAEQHVPVANITVQTQMEGQSAPSEQQKPQGGQTAYATNSVRKQEQAPIQPVMAWEGARSASRLDIHM